MLAIVFEKWWPDMEDRYSAILAAATRPAAALPQRPDRELLEELLERTRALTSQAVVADQLAVIAMARGALQRIIDALPQALQQLLRQIAAFKSAGAYADAESLCRQHPEDTERLIAMGFLLRGDDGTVKMSQFLSRKVLGRLEPIGA